jgi:UDP-N-acetylglucosamine pyrophosphorylase
MSKATTDDRIAARMRDARVGDPTIRAFLAAVGKVRGGDRGLIPESTIEPVGELPRLEALPAPETHGGVLSELAVVKLNGGLGTSMGLDGPKSLIPVKGDRTFLDYIALQILHLRGGKAEPAFYLMNSYSTRDQSLNHLRRFPELSGGEPLDFLQNKVPKLEAETLEPVAWPDDPELEWCPPGHGDLYASLASTGLLERLLGRGIRVAFVSNADNLGATVDTRLVAAFLASGDSFWMEVAERTAADRKGGHLARRKGTGRLLLRESAQTPKEDDANFQDIERHRYFNTNNLWIRLDHLRDAMAANAGTLPLPLITNHKTVDPKNSNSTKVLQLESAMGAAIECFERSGGVVVSRDRFAPVKTTADLLAVRSDAYISTPDHRLVLDGRRGGRPPVVVLDAAHYRVLADFDRYLGAEVPSLVGCDRLTVKGRVKFPAGVVCRGTVEFANAGEETVEVPAREYRDEAWCNQT